MGGGVSRCDPIPGPGVGGFQSPASQSPINDRGFFYACSARSSSAPHPRRPSISCATEKACHRLDRFSWADCEGEPQRQHWIALSAVYPSAPTSTNRPQIHSKFRATAQPSENLIQPDQIECCDADRIDANSITNIGRTPTNRGLIL